MIWFCLIRNISFAFMNVRYNEMLNNVSFNLFHVFVINILWNNKCCFLNRLLISEVEYEMWELNTWLSHYKLSICHFPRGKKRE
jgi:hypothetical protein